MDEYAMRVEGVAPALPIGTASPPGRFELVGVGLFVALAGWVQLSGLIVGGDPAPTTLLVLTTAVTLFVSWILSQAFPRVVPVIVAVAVAALAYRFGEDAVGNVHSPLGYQNATAALYAVGAGGAAIAALRTSSDSGLLRGGLSLLGLGLMALPFLSQAIGGAIVAAAVAVGVAVAWWHRAAVVRRWVRGLAALSGAVLLVTVAMGLAYPAIEIGAAAGLTERRLQLWDESLDLVAEHPLFGVGPGEFAEESPTARSDRDARWAHNEPLQLAAEVGLPGLLLLVAIVGWTFTWLTRGRSRRGAIVGAALLAGAVAHACVDYVWHFPEVVLALAAVVGSAPRWR